MSINIYYSNTFRGAFDRLSKRLSENLDKSNIIIVPDRFSLTIEKAILDKLDISGSMNIEVMSFSRLAAQTLGNKMYKCLSSESAVMLLAKVIRANSDKLLCYSNVKDIISFSKDMYTTITMIRNNLISIDALNQSLSNIKNVGILKKTKDIIFLYEKYLQELSNQYDDATTRLEKLCEEIYNNAKIKASHIYITDFYEFNNIEYNVIEQLMLYAKSLNIALIKKDINHYSTNSRIYPNYRIEEIADNLNLECSKEYNYYSLNDVNSIIEKRIFSYERGKNENCNDRIKLFYAEDIESELIAIAREIKALVKKGFRYKDISLVTGDIDTYAPYLIKTFERFEIPYFIDRKENLRNHPLIKFMISVFDFISENHSIHYAYEIIKNPFSNIHYKEADIFENYCIKYGIKGTQLKKRFTYGIDKEIKIPEKVRKKIIYIINHINTSDNTANNFLNMINKLLKYVKADNIILDLMEKQLEYQDIINSEITKQIPNKINELFNEIQELTSDSILTFEEFIIMIKTSLMKVDISMIPQYTDCVFIGEPIESRYAIIKVMFVVGASDNVIPKERKENNIITSNELKEWNLSIHPTVKQFMNLDKFHILQLLIKPEVKLILSYSIRSFQGDINNPSIIIKQLQNIFNLKLQPFSIILDEKYDINDNDRAKLYAYKFANYKNGLYELVIALRGFKEARLNDYDLLPYDALYNLLNDKDKNHIKEINNLYKDTKPYINLGNKLFFKKRKLTSVSQLECYFKCPFMHFVKYGLGASVREEATIQSNLRGIIIHAALELFLKYAQKEDLYFNITEKKRQEITERVIDEIFAIEEYNHIFDDNTKQLMSDSITRCITYVLYIISSSKFKPFLMEAEFGQDKDYPCIEIEYGNYKKVLLRGKIDRIDKYKNNVIIIDYKTGNIKDLIKELYYGVKVQLFVYLKALSSDKINSVGAMYMQLKDNFVKADDEKYAYTGVILKDHLHNLDPNAINNKSLLIKSNKKNVIEDNYLDDLLNYAINLIKKAANEIDRGYIQPKPYTDICEYCEFIDICHSRLTKPLLRKFNKVNQESFDVVKNV